MLKRALFSLALVAALAVPMQTQAQVTGTFTVTGSSGSWFLDFAFTNNYSAASGQYVYYIQNNAWGGSSPTGVTTGAPAGWTTRTDDWFITPGGGLAPQTMMNGFLATSFLTDAPTTVDLFAFAYNGSSNPSNTFTATRVSVPEPGSMMLLATGLIGLVGVRRRRQDLIEDV